MTTQQNVFEAYLAGLAVDAPWIELYTLDATICGGGVYSFTPGPFENGVLSFGGVEYQYLPIQGEGFEYTGQGTQPTPTLKIDNTNNMAMGMVIAFGDLLGATITRIRTFTDFVDGQPKANTAYASMPDIYRVERKAYASYDYIQWELATGIDVQGRKLPFRVVLQGACNYTYRVYNATTSTFMQGTCPYAGSVYLDVTDTPTTPNLDVCGRRLTSCNLRYNPTVGSGTQPPAVPLPTGAFPGATVGTFT